MIEANNFIEDIIVKDLESGKIKEVITRFPPEPNGFLHLGHAKSLCINFGIAKKFGGKCNLRFDDTNPIKEEALYVESIKKDIKYLGFKWSKLNFASDYFDQIFEYAKVLINKGLAYVCDHSGEEIKNRRGTLTNPGENSDYRDRSIVKNLALFEDMKNGKFADGEKVLRAKIDMQSPNMNMRDPVIYRILKASHHRTGDKWCIYPMYDFTHPLSDAIEGITHSICTLEFEDHRPLYEWVLNNCETKCKPQQIEFARLNLTNTIMSKRYLKQLVDDGIVDGWDDPRMPTLSGVKKRGYKEESIKAFCESIGVSKSNSEVDIAMLEFNVRDSLHSDRRVMVVSDPLKLTLTNYEGSENLSINPNPKDENCDLMNFSVSKNLYIERDDFQVDADKKFFRLKPDGYVRLKGAFIIKYESHTTDSDGKVLEVFASVVENSRSGSDTSGVKVKGVIHFVDGNNNIPCKINKFDYLYKNGEINKDSKKVYNGFASSELGDYKKDTRFQFLRVGYFSMSKKTAKCLEFNEIVPLKSSY